MAIVLIYFVNVLFYICLLDLCYVEAIGTGRDDITDLSRISPHLWFNNTYIIDDGLGVGLTVVQLKWPLECSVEVNSLNVMDKFCLSS